jgi:hypothetical protein
MIDGLIYIFFEGTDTQFPDKVNIFDNDKKQFVPADFKLVLPRRKI